jgi:mRNA interferase MazF
MSGYAESGEVQVKAIQGRAHSIAPGNIIQVDFPHVRPAQQTDGAIETSKKRPALVLYIEKNQMVVAYISSKVPNLLNPADVLVLDNNPSFGETGLKRSSVIRLGVLATVPIRNATGLYGSVSSDLRSEINSKLITCFKI